MKLVLERLEVQVGPHVIRRASLDRVVGNAVKVENKRANFDPNQRCLCSHNSLSIDCSMARGKGTPKRNQIDPDFSPTSPVPPSPSPSTPRRTTSASSSGTNSPRTAISLSQALAPPKPTRGPLPAEAETTYHQRLRGILIDCKKLRRQWNELVIRGLVGRVRAAIELWVDVEYAKPFPVSFAEISRSRD